MVYNSGMELHVNQGLEPKSWDHFILQHPEANLLQSWHWGEFQRSLGHIVWRLAVTDGNAIIAQLSVFKLPLRFGRYIFYAPRAILLNKNLPAHQQYLAMKMIIDYMKKIADTEKSIMLRTDPPIPPEDTAALSIYKSIGFVLSNKSTQPKSNWQLDITPKPSNLLMLMKIKVRYNVRLSEKKGLEIRETTNPDKINIFTDLMHATAIRDNFTPHSDNYYRQQLAVLGKQNMLSLLVVYDQEEPLSAALISFFGSTATYLHGASSDKNREKKPVYALQWAAIQAAKERGCSIYDFGGVNLDPNHAWAGISRFKTGFGGQEVNYIGNLELPLNPSWFRLYKLVTRFKHA